MPLKQRKPQKVSEENRSSNIEEKEKSLNNEEKSENTTDVDTSSTDNQSGFKYKIQQLIQTLLGKNFEKEQPPEETISLERFKGFVKRERPYKIAAWIVFILYIVGVVLPLWYYTTSVYRSPFPTFPPNRTINVPVRVSIATTDESLTPALQDLIVDLEANLTKIETVFPLEFTWSIVFVGLRSYSELESDHDLAVPKSDSYDVNVAIVGSKTWSHFSATQVQLGKGKWSFVQWPEDSIEGARKAGSRVTELISEILIDVAHLNTIVKRDLRQQMPAWQIATLPLSHQKRLVWDSAPIATEYHIQVVHLHDNASPATEDLEIQHKTSKALRVFANMVKQVTDVKVTSEHLWDFDITNSFLRKDVQDRWTLSHDGMEELVKKVDSQQQTTLKSGTVLKFVVLETPMPVVILDQMGEDSTGLALAAWGAIFSRNENTESRAVAALRIQLGLDGDLVFGWWRPPVALCQWEVARARLRAAVDNAMRAASAIRALDELTLKVTNIVINDDVAAWATEAVRLLDTGLTSGTMPDFDKLLLARKLADRANTDHSLLALLYFPMDQRTAVFLPFLLPVVFPVITLSFSLIQKIVVRDWY